MKSLNKKIYLRLSLCIVTVVVVLSFYYIKDKADATYGSVDMEELDHSIDLAKHYLTNHILPSGRTVYRTKINDSSYTSNKYNILRHAGTTYSMYLYDKYIEKDYFKSLRLTMVDYLIKTYIKPYNNLYGAVSKVEEEGGEFNKVKLGALGLALIGISTLYDNEQEYEKESIKNDHKKISEGLAGFISFLQKPDGSFTSYFNYDDLEKDESFTSLYYPGEASLGLLFLYEKDKNKEWFDIAKKALLYLADSRRSKKYEIPFDHWAMIATEKLLSYPEHLTQEEKEKLIYHIVQICFSIIPKQIRSSRYSGDFLNNNKPCSIGTIVEGLSASYKVLARNIQIFDSLKANFFDKKISLDEILTTIKYSVNYLIRAQVKEEGDWLGAIPSRYDWKEAKSSKARIVQIDNIQHVLSGWINYKNLVEEFFLNNNNL